MYNAEMHIVKCLDSILAQSLSELEIIIVDDCSTDRSHEIVENYISGNKCANKVQLFKQKSNQGPGIARNIGIENAVGEYVTFLDSDDWVENDAYSALYTKAKKHDAELCFCNAIMDFANGETRTITNPKVTSGELGVEEKKSFLSNFVTYCVTYLYQRNFLKENEITFPKGRSSEDSVFLTKCILNCERIASVEKIFYHYVINHNSLTQSPNATRYKDKLVNLNLVVSERENHKTYKNEIEYIYIKKGVILSVINYVRDNKKVDVSVIKEICTRLKTEIPAYKKNEYYKRDYTCRILLFCLSKATRISANLLSAMFRYNKKKKTIA